MNILLQGRPESTCVRDCRSAGVMPFFFFFKYHFLFSLLLAQTSYGISKIGSSFLNALLSTQCSVGLVDWLKSLISWANTSWPFSCKRIINGETGFPTGSQCAMVLTGELRSILVFPAIIYLTASNMPMKATLQRWLFPGKPREGRQAASWKTSLPSSSLGVMAFPIGSRAPKSMAGLPGEGHCKENVLHKFYLGSVRALRTQLSSTCHQWNLAPSGFSSSSRCKLTSIWEQVLRPFTWFSKIISTSL